MLFVSMAKKSFSKRSSVTGAEIPETSGAFILSAQDTMMIQKEKRKKRFLKLIQFIQEE